MASSVKTTSTKNTGTTLSRTSTSSNYTRQFKESLIDLFLNLNNVKRFALDRWVFLGLEIASLILFLLSIFKDILLWDDDISHSTKYMFIFMDPMLIVSSFISYIIIFLVSGAFIVTGFILIVYISYTKTSNEILCTVGIWFCRLTRTILFYPLLFIFISPMNCDLFGGTLVMNNYDGYNCVEFPFLLFWIIGIMFIIITILVGIMDALFLMDKFKGIDLWTASPDGRFSLFIFIIQVSCILLCAFFDYQDFMPMIIVNNVFCMILLLISIIILIRFIPFFHFQYVCILGTALCLVINLEFTLLILLTTKEWWFSLFILLNCIGIPLLWIALCGRYACLLSFFRKNKIRSNIWLCYFSVDVVIGIFVKEKFNQLLCIKRWNKMSPIDMMTVITTLLNDEDFEKTKNLCQMLTCITIDKNSQLAKLILNHTSTIMRDDLWDVELSLQFYKIKTTDIQHTGDSGKKKKLKLIGELGRASKREDELAKMLQMLLQELASEDRKISFSNFPQILTSIQINHEFCESIYEKLVKVTPCPKTYNAYARYLMRFLNDKKTANLYIKEAKQLAYTQSNKSASDTMEIQNNENTSNSGSSSIENSTDENNSSTIKSFERGDSDVVNMINQHGIVLEKRDFRSASPVASDSSEESHISETKEISSDSSEESHISETKEISSDSSSKQLEIIQSPPIIRSEQLHIPETVMPDELEYETNNQLSYRQKDSVITKRTSSSVGSDIRTHLSKKVVGGTYCSIWFIRALCLGVFFTGITVVILIFTMSFVLQNGFEDSAELVVLGARIQKSVAESAHYLRKLQVSHYGPDETPFAYERNPLLFMDLITDHCKKTLDRTKSLYERMDESQKKPWHDIHVVLYDQILEYHEDARDHVYQMKTYNLIDGTSMFGEKCAQFHRFSKYDWNGMNNNSLGNRIRDNLPFVFVTLNEPMLNKGLGILLTRLIEYEEGTSFTLQMVYIMIPVTVSLLFLLLCCAYCAYCCQQRKSFKGFLIIPKEQLHEIHDNLSDNSECKNSEARVDTTRCSLIQRFFILTSISILVIMLIAAIFTVIGVLTCNQFVSRNNEYDYILQVTVLINRMHLWAVELLYRDRSLFTNEEVVIGFQDDINILVEIYKAIRIGSDKLGLSGNDNEKKLNEIYYRDNCDTTEYFEHRFDYLVCLNLNQKVEMIIAAATRLLNSNFTNPMMRGDSDYELIIMLDNFSNGTVHDRGALQDQLVPLEQYVEKKVDVYLSYLQSFSLLLIILGLPIFIIIYCILFRKYPSRLNRNLSQVRRIMMLMSKRILMSKNIYEYVSGKTQFKTAFSREKTNRIDIVCDTQQFHGYGIIVFNNHMSIIRYNTTADELFNIKASEATKITDLFTTKGCKTFNKWKKSSKKWFSGEIMVKYDDQEYCVLADISRNDGDLYSGIFENLESSKKKDLLRESERLDEKTMTLISNILPKEIAQGMKVEDLLRGECLITEHKRATAYFSDICNFTGMAQLMEVNEIIKLLHDFFSRIDDLCDEHKLEKIKTIGDCYFAISGIPTYKPLHAKMAMDFAIAVLKMVTALNETREDSKKIYIRTGLSSGNLVAGIIGKRKFCYDTWGPMINEAARMEHHGHPGKIQISRTTYESIFDKYEFMETKIHLQGIGITVPAYVHTPLFMNLDELKKIKSEPKFKEKSVDDEII